MSTRQAGNQIQILELESKQRILTYNGNVLGRNAFRDQPEPRKPGLTNGIDGNSKGVAGDWDGWDCRLFPLPFKVVGLKRRLILKIGRHGRL